MYIFKEWLNKCVVKVASGFLNSSRITKESDHVIFTCNNNEYKRGILGNYCKEISEGSFFRVYKRFYFINIKYKINLPLVRAYLVLCHMGRSIQLFNTILLFNRFHQLKALKEFHKNGK